MQTLKQLIHPVIPEDFLNNNWGKSPLFVSRESEHLSDLVSLTEVNEYLGSSRLSYPFVKIVSEGRVLDSTLYTIEQGETYALVDRKKLFKYFSSGCTIALQVSHLTFPKLRKFTGLLESELGIRIHANLYLTPGNSQGFNPHFDPHEVFAIQISGEKNWNIYDRPVEKPAINQQLSPAVQEQYLKTEAAHKLNMQPGDLLYIPRGVVHDAYTANGNHSLHITFGLHPLTKIDAIKLMLERMDRIDSFRSYLYEFSQSTTLGQQLVDQFSREIVAYLKETLQELPAKRNSVALDKYYCGDDHLINLIHIDRLNSIVDVEEFDIQKIGENHQTNDETELMILDGDFSKCEWPKVKPALKSLLIKGVIRMNRS